MLKKIVQINTTCGIGSTGKICVDISKMLTEHQIENYILYSHKSNGYELGISCCSKLYTKFQALKSRSLGNYGFNSVLETKRMIKYLESIHPDIVHLHNIHGHDCNLERLFKYFKKTRMKVVWTFHDCWAFTGYCPHFAMVGCDKWKKECDDCVQHREYSFYKDESKRLYRLKKKLFSEVDLIIVTPSQWLRDMVRYSFLKNKPVHIINNGIDLNVFKPTPSCFKKQYHISEEKRMVLGVAFGWNQRKGLDIFCELDRYIDHEKYQIVLVGTNEKIDTFLPETIISIHRTQSQKELAEIYSAADVFVNPTREENYPTVNMEALACGTPVVTFDTGGSPEMLTSKTAIIVGEKSSIAILNAIEDICNSDGYSQDDCAKSAKHFAKSLKYQEYIKLYKTLFNI